MGKFSSLQTSDDLTLKNESLFQAVSSDLNIKSADLEKNVLDASFNTNVSRAAFTDTVATTELNAKPASEHRYSTKTSNNLNLTDQLTPKQSLIKKVIERLPTSGPVKLAADLMTSVAVTGFAATAIQLLSNNFGKIAELFQSNSNLINAHSIGITAGLLAISTLIKIGLLKFKTFGREIGNSSSSQYLTSEIKSKLPASSLLLSIAAAPLFEELTFRGLPAALLGRNGPQWAIGIGISALFAVMHNFGALTEQDKQNGKVLSLGKYPIFGELGFKLDKIPLTQFIGGIMYWGLMQHFGIWSSIAAHAGNNLVANLLPPEITKTEAPKISY